MHPAEFFHRTRAAHREFHERAVGEDHVGGHFLFARERAAQHAECTDECGVGGGDIEFIITTGARRSAFGARPASW